MAKSFSVPAQGAGTEDETKTRKDAVEGVGPPSDRHDETDKKGGGKRKKERKTDRQTDRQTDRRTRRRPRCLSVCLSVGPPSLVSCLVCFSPRPVLPFCFSSAGVLSRLSRLSRFCRFVSFFQCAFFQFFQFFSRSLRTPTCIGVETHAVVVLEEVVAARPGIP